MNSPRKSWTRDRTGTATDAFDDHAIARLTVAAMSRLAIRHASNPEIIDR
jgi:hypothetical protein